MNAIDKAFLRAFQEPSAEPPAPASEPEETLPVSPAGVTEASPGSGGESLYFQVWAESATTPLPPLRSGDPAQGPATAPVATPERAPSAALHARPASATVTPPPATSSTSIEDVWQPQTANAPDRQPLSTFAQPEPPIDSVFRPGLEVDAFRWPDACEELTTHWAASLEPAVNALLATVEAGRTMTGIAGAAEGCGATTLTLCLARLAARAGKSVVLVDGDFTDPQLATRLGLAVDSGWEHILSGATSLADNVIHSRGDQVSLLPLVAGGLRASEMIDSIHAPVTAGILRQNYDLVLIDFGSIAGGGQTAIARKIARQFRLEAALLATDRADGGLLARVAQVAPELAEVMIGTVENQITVAAAG